MEYRQVCGLEIVIRSFAFWIEPTDPSQGSFLLTHGGNFVILVENNEKIRDF